MAVLVEGNATVVAVETVDLAGAVVMQEVAEMHPEGSLVSLVIWSALPLTMCCTLLLI
jgi:hypothetical protein